MLLINAKILTEDWKFVSADLRVSNGKIADLGVDLPVDEDLVIDCNGGYLIPGLVETHFHGALGEDAHKPTENTLDAFSRFEVSRGITTFVAGPGSVSDDAVKYFLHLSKTFMAQKPSGAKMAGIYLEGPFVSYTRRGGHAPELIQAPSADKLRCWQEMSGGTVLKTIVAPELEGAEEAIRTGVSCGMVVEIGHTSATYEQAMQAIEWGATLSTHTFNGMEPLNHREPGVLGAVLTDERVTCELIADFGHVAPAAVKLVYLAKGRDRVNLISDSMEAAGLGDGVYQHVDGRTLTVQNGLAKFENGTIAGSACSIMEGVRNLVSIDIPLEDAVKMASYNPAKTIGMANSIGSIAIGKCADLVLLDKELQVKKVWVDGEEKV